MRRGLKVPGKVPACRSRVEALERRTPEAHAPARHRRTGRGRPDHVRQPDPRIFARARKPKAASVIARMRAAAACPLFARSFPDATSSRAMLETRGGQVRARYGWLKAGGRRESLHRNGQPGETAARIARQIPRAPCLSGARCGREVALLARHVWAPAHGPHIGICWRSGKSRRQPRAAICAARRPGPDFLRALPGTPVSRAIRRDAEEEIARSKQMSGRTILVPHGIDQKNELDRACALLIGARCGGERADRGVLAGGGCGRPDLQGALRHKLDRLRPSPSSPSRRPAACVMPDKRGRLGGYVRESDVRAHTARYAPSFGALRHQRGLQIGGDARGPCAIHRHQSCRMHVRAARGIGQQRGNRARDGSAAQHRPRARAIPPCRRATNADAERA